MDSCFELLNRIKDDLLIVSVSGGVDSMVLLDILVKQKKQVVVVFFDHQTRDEIKNEEKLVNDYCNEHDILFYSKTLTIENGNFHNEAHQKRYSYLKEIAKLHNTSYILTAHHLDDLLESVLIKLTRGSNLLGYAGMQPIYQKGDFVFIKPLLYVSKDTIYTYSQNNKIKYLEDSSNSSNDYLRNRYRNQIIPTMKLENPLLLNQIKQYHHQLTNAFNYIRSVTIDNFTNDLKIDITKFNTLDAAIKDDMLAYLLEQYDINLSFQLILDLKGLIENEKPNLSYTLSNDYQFIKSYNEAYITTNKTISKKVYKLDIGKTHIENMAIFTFLEQKKEDSKENTKLCYNKLAFPLLVRNRLDGDVLAYHYGHKKLKKLLIDLKIPLLERDHLWIITDSNNQILWIPGIYLNQTLGNENEIYFSITED